MESNKAGDCQIDVTQQDFLEETLDFFVFTNGIIHLGLFFLFAAITVNSAAVSDSPLAEGTLLDETGCQGCRLAVLGHYLPDLGAAT